MYYIYKSRIYIKNPSEAPKGVKIETGERGGLYYESEEQSNQQDYFQSQEKEPIDANKKDFLDTLKYDYIVDFNKKDLKIFENFYDSYPDELRNNHSFLTVIGDISNNLPKEITYNISKTSIELRSENQYIQESGGYWAAVYDHDYKYIALNKEVYQSLSRDYYTQEQYHRVVLHEYGHKLIYDDIISEQMMFELWETKERVSQQAMGDYNENVADSFAAFLMALSINGDVEDNIDIRDFKEEFPKTYQIWSNWLIEVKSYEI